MKEEITLRSIFEIIKSKIIIILDRHSTRNDCRGGRYKVLYFT